MDAHHWLWCELCRLSVDMVVAPFCYSTERYKTSSFAVAGPQHHYLHDSVFLDFVK